MYPFAAKTTKQQFISKIQEYVFYKVANLGSFLLFAICSSMNLNMVLARSMHGLCTEKISKSLRLQTR